jgi:hypothetical protein
VLLAFTALALLLVIGSSCFCEKIAQNMAQPIFCQTFLREKSIPIYDRQKINAHITT